MSTATLTAERKPVLSAARPQAAPVPPAPPTGRDTRGRFVPGNPGGPGNPFARQVAQLRRDIIANLTSRDIAQIIATLKMKAISGDMTAVKLLFQYAVGKPADPINPDTLDIDEFQQLYAPRKEIMKQMNEATKTFEPEFCSGMVRLLASMLHAKVMDFANMSHEDRQRFLENPGVFGSAAATPPPSARAAEDDAILAGRCEDIDDNDDQDSDDLPEMTAPPSPNRSNGNAAPSTNGGNGHTAASAKDRGGRSPSSTNGGNGLTGPSAKGDDGTSTPSTNGGEGNARPSEKGGNGPASPSPKPRKCKQQGKNRITLPMRRGSRF